MTEAPKLDPRLRSTLRIAFAVSLLGSCGAVNGLSQLGDTPMAADAGPLDTSGDAASREAAVAANDILLDLVRRDPLRRVFGAANVVLSILLVVAGAVLTMRRQAAIWWVTQATLANSLFILAQTLAIMRRIHELAPSLAPALDAYVRATAPEPAPDGGDLGMVMTFMMMAVPALWGLFRIAVHVGVAWRARRPDVRALLSDTGRS